MSDADRMSLAYRIASMRPVEPQFPEINKEGFHARCKAEARLIQEVPHLSLDNVAAFVAGHDRQEWDYGEHIPNWAPPFGRFFAEWNEATEWNFDKGAGPVRLGRAPAQFGWLVTAAPVADDACRQLGNWERLIGGFAGVRDFALDGDSAEAMRSLMPQTHWILAAQPWLSMMQKPFCGAPVRPCATLFVFVGGSGKYLWHCNAGPCLNDESAQLMNEGLIVLGLGLSFCHCKNVVRRESVADRGDRWHRRTAVPRLKRYTLEIGPMRETLRGEGRSGEVGIGKAMHICRGHFANYSESHPMFGKYVGSFWRPDHVRGSAANGRIEKAYSVVGESPR